jgi:hypothetical protein
MTADPSRPRPLVAAWQPSRWADYGALAPG